MEDIQINDEDVGDIEIRMDGNDIEVYIEGEDAAKNINQALEKVSRPIAFGLPFVYKVTLLSCYT